MSTDPRYITMRTGLTDGQRQYVLCHEMSHLFDLNYRNDTYNSCMYAYDQGVAIGPDQHDYDEIYGIYNHAP
jgi:hypothetical protein